MAKIGLLLPFILAWEGGFVNDPADAGGATNKGVTLATWRQVGYDKDGDGDIDVEDLKLITDADTLNVVLKPRYWDKWRADEIRSQRVANMLVDWLWSSGKYGITIPQRILGVAQDGVVGPKTLAAVNGADANRLFDELFEARLDYLYGIVDSSVRRYEAQLGRSATEAELSKNTNKRFLRGWIRRLEALRELRIEN